MRSALVDYFRNDGGLMVRAVLVYTGLDTISDDRIHLIEDLKLRHAQRPDDFDFLSCNLTTVHGWLRTIAYWTAGRRSGLIFFEKGGEPVKRADVMRQLARSMEHLRCEFGVARLALFGSTARDDAGEGSDVDVLVAFDGPATSARYFGVQFYLEDLLGCPVDLVTDKGLRPELRPFIEQEAIHV